MIILIYFLFGAVLGVLIASNAVEYGWLRKALAFLVILVFWPIIVVGFIVACIR